MKRLVLMIVPALICGVMFTGCGKSQAEEEEIVIKNTESYYRNLVGGDEEGASIKVQALHYEKSELIRDNSTNFILVYHYKPKNDFVGTDCVVIDVTHNNTGLDPKTHTVKINFVITK